MTHSGSIRLDKWLWAARFFKTRSLAAEAISGGKVHLNGARVKPAKAVSIGDELSIRRGEEKFTVTVLDLSARRGPAAIASQLYKESEESRSSREQDRELRRLQTTLNPHPTTRPSKKERRQIHRFISKT